MLILAMAIAMSACFWAAAGGSEATVARTSPASISTPVSHISQTVNSREVNANSTASGDRELIIQRDVKAQSNSITETSDSPVEGVVVGVIADIAENQLLVATDLFGVYTVTLSIQTRIWKGDWEGHFPLEIGDEVKISGNIDHSGKRGDADQIQANIIAISGNVLRATQTAEGQQLIVYDTQVGTIIVQVDSRYRIWVSNQNQSFAINEIDWPRVQSVDLVGLKLKEKLVKADRMSVTYP